MNDHQSTVFYQLAFDGTPARSSSKLVQSPPFERSQSQDHPVRLVTIRPLALRQRPIPTQRDQSQQHIDKRGTMGTSATPKYCYPQKRWPSAVPRSPSTISRETSVRSKSTSDISGQSERDPVTPISISLGIIGTNHMLGRSDSHATSSSISDSLSKCHVYIPIMLDQPSPPKQEGPPPPPRRRSRPQGNSRSVSDYHLGLSDIGKDDSALFLGPSLPNTPTMSPHRPSRIPSYSIPSKMTSRLSSLNGLAEPMTPSRAGAKALQMLGKPLDSGIKPAKWDRVKAKVDKVRAKKTSDIFWQMPSSFLHEVNMLLGDSSKANWKSTGPNVTDENGEIWHDTDERQEFAWLLSEQIAKLSPQTRNKVKAQCTDKPAINQEAEVSLISKPMYSVDDDTSEEDAFVMTIFKSVPTMSNPARRNLTGTKGAHKNELFDITFRDSGGDSELCRKISPKRSPKLRPPPLALQSLSPSHSLSKVVVLHCDRSVTKTPIAPANTPYTPFGEPRTAPMPPQSQRRQIQQPLVPVVAHVPAPTHRSQASTASLASIEAHEWSKGGSFFIVDESPSPSNQTLRSIVGKGMGTVGAVGDRLKRQISRRVEIAVRI